MVVFLAAAGFGVAGVLASIAAKNWSDNVLDRIPSALPFSDVATNEITDIRNGMAATAVSQPDETCMTLASTVQNLDVHVSCNYIKSLKVSLMHVHAPHTGNVIPCFWVWSNSILLCSVKIGEIQEP